MSSCACGSCDDITLSRPPKRQFFRGGSFVVFGGEKGERKEGRKFVEHSAKPISWILHLRSCRKQIIVATLLPYYYYIISLKYSCLATSFAFEQESRMLCFECIQAGVKLLLIWYQYGRELSFMRANFFSYQIVTVSSLLLCSRTDCLLSLESFAYYLPHRVE